MIETEREVEKGNKETGRDAGRSDRDRKGCNEEKGEEGREGGTGR